MNIEITIRFKDPHAAPQAFFEDLIEHFDIAAIFQGRIVGGLYFRTERSPVHFFEWLLANNFEMSDFDNIEFKPC